jgi:transcription termination factor Rho
MAQNNSTFAQSRRARKNANGGNGPNRGGPNRRQPNGGGSGPHNRSGQGPNRGGPRGNQRGNQSGNPQQRHQHRPQPGPQVAGEQGPRVHNVAVEGLLCIPGERGDGQLRDPGNPLRSVNGGVFVPRQIINELHLRSGVILQGNQKGKTMNRVDLIEGRLPEEYARQPALYDATALDPQPMIKLEHDPAELTTRAIDLLAPVGFGQRGLIVAPPRTGKTILMQNIARGIHANYPNVQIVLLLVDERPEEVTDMKRNVPGTVYASSNDNTVEKHLDLAQLVIERCKRQVEFGADIVVLLDSLTRLGRAFNTGGPSGGRTLSGGLDNRALEIPKKLFGAARKLEHGGSLTIIATCLVDTGSRMDQVIFEEFKGTGNLELTLDRGLANARIYPALNIAESGTRKEEKLLDAKQLAGSRAIRRHLLNMSPPQAMKTLLEVLGKHKTNEALFNSIRT